MRNAGFAGRRASSTACDSTALKVRLTPRMEANFNPFVRHAVIRSRQVARVSAETGMSPSTGSTWRWRLKV